MARKNKRKWGLIVHGENTSMDEVVHYAKMAEQAGAESLWATEFWRDGFVPLTAMAAACPNLRVGTGVIHWARPPLTVEITAMALAEYTHGKFILGLGTAAKQYNEEWYGISYRKPVTRMREYIECIRTMWTASPTHPVSYEGEFFQVKDYRRFVPPVYDHIPIYLAAVLPPMIQLAGSHADGMVLNSLNTPKYIQEVLRPNLKKGMAKAGRSAKDFEICAIKPCAVNKDRKRARDLARHAIAFYSTIYYFDIVLDPLGFTEAKLKIRAASKRGDIQGMLNAVPDDMVDALTFAGTADDVRRQAKASDGLYDTTLVFCPFFFVDPAETKANHAAMIEAFAE